MAAKLEYGHISIYILYGVVPGAATHFLVDHLPAAPSIVGRRTDRTSCSPAHSAPEDVPGFLRSSPVRILQPPTSLTQVATVAARPPACSWTDGGLWLHHTGEIVAASSTATCVAVTEAQYTFHRRLSLKFVVPIMISKVRAVN